MSSPVTPALQVFLQTPIETVASLRSLRVVLVLITLNRNAVVNFSKTRAKVGTPYIMGGEDIFLCCVNPWSGSIIGRRIRFCT